MSSSGGGDELCVANHRGPYCKLCKADYAPNSDGQCRPCSDAGHLAADAIAGQPLLFVLILVLLAMPWLLPLAKKILTRASARMKIDIVSRLRPVMKIALGFAQVVGLISQVYQIEYPPAFDLFVNKFYMPFNINIFAAMQVYGWLSFLFLGPKKPPLPSRTR